MYKITRTNNDFVTEGIINPSVISNRKTLTNLQLAMLTVSESQLNTTVFFQDLPECDKKYWTIKDKAVVEMTDSEKEYKDNEIIYTQMKQDFLYNRYRITVLNDLESELKTGLEYFTSKTDTTSPIFNNMYRLIEKLVVGRQLKSNVTKDFEYIVYCNTIDELFQAVIENDERILIEDIETFNPANLVQV